MRRVAHGSGVVSGSLQRDLACVRAGEIASCVVLRVKVNKDGH